MSSLENNRVEKLMILSSFKDNRILVLAHSLRVETCFLTNEELKKLARCSSHQGVVALVKDFTYSSVEEIISAGSKKDYPLVIMLDEINDPHNLGAIIRSVDAFNADGVIFKKHNQVQLTDVVAKTSTGAINYVKVASVTNLANTIKEFKKAGYWVVATDGKSDKTIYDLDYKMKTLLIVGSEGFGISKLVMENADFTVKIPLNGHVNSLNASVAAAICIAHITCQKSS